MLNQNSIATMTLAAALAIADAQAFDESKYPDLSGQWARTGVVKCDPTKPMGRGQLEFLITPNTTHIFFDDQIPRRVYTDGRDWPKDIEPSLRGYSIGKWIDENGDGRYDVLEIETRGLKGPRSY